MEVFMEITTKQLRTEPGRIVSQAANGQEIIITYRGKPSAKIVPLVSRRNLVLEEPVRTPAGTRDRGSPSDELFGLWKNRDDIKDVEQFVRNLRKGRRL